MSFRIGNTRLKIHPLLCFLLAACAVNRTLPYSSILALLFHESAHFLCGKWMHIPIREIEIGVLGGVMQCDTETLSKGKRILLSLAGPLGSLLGYATCYYFLSRQTPHVLFFLDCLRMNLLLLLVNLLPILPLDGGQIVLQIFDESALCRRILGGAAVLAGLMLIALSVHFAFMKKLILSPALAGCFLIYAATAQKRTAAGVCLHRALSLRSSLESKRVLPVCTYAASADQKLVHIIPQLPGSKYVRLIVLDEQSGRELGQLNVFSVAHLLLENNALTLRDAVKDSPTSP